MKAFCTSHITDDYLDVLREHMDITCGGDSQHRIYVPKEELIEALQGTDILIVSYEIIDEEVIRRSPDLKLIASERDGPEENIDIAAATKAGIPVVHSLGRCILPVTEHTFALMLAINRRLILSNSFIRSGWWDKNNPGKFAELIEVTERGLGLLHGRTLGVIGLGRNGKSIAELGFAFGMKVIGYDPYADKEELEKKGISLTSLDNLMTGADFVCVMARLTQDTENLVGEHEISLMKPDACFINTARAGLVDYDALYNALKEGRIRAAALDVYKEEPLPLDSRWFDIDPDKLLMTPHHAGLCVERDSIHSEELAKYILEYLKGIVPDSLMNKSVFNEPEFENRGKLIFGAELN